MLEIGFGQADTVRSLLADAGWSNVEFIDDLQGIPRVAKADI
jgi:methylase of polypeptide subunit release factors